MVSAYRTTWLTAGKEPCKKTKIAKGSLRLGVWVEMMGNGSFKWRHWGCR